MELRDWAADDPKNLTVHALYVNLLPLEQSAVDRLKVWLPKLSYPVRIGEHNQTAFAMGLMIDYARRVDDQDFTKLLLAKARQFYLADKNCPLAYEPSGEDFLSPCLAEADLMRRVLSPPSLPPGCTHFFRKFLATDPPSGCRPRNPPIHPTPSWPTLMA